MSSSSIICLPPLADTECTLLDEHKGCTKCRCFYAGHRSQSCPNGFPVGKSYKTLTLTNALAAKKAKATAKTSTKAVAATIEPVNSDEEIMATAAVLSDSSGAFDSNSEDCDTLSDHDMSG